MKIPMSGSYIAKTRDPQRRSMGCVIFIFRDNKLGNVLEKISDKPDATTLLAMSVEEFQIPKISINTFDIRRDGDRRKYPSSVENSDVAVTIRDFVDQPTVKLLSAWLTLVYNPRTAQIGLRNDVNCDAYFILFDHATGKPTRVVRAVDLYITELDSGDISQGDSDYVKVTATFAVWRVYLLNDLETLHLEIPYTNVTMGLGGFKSGTPKPGHPVVF